MAVYQGDGRGVVEEPPIADLVRQFGQDGATLVRQEIALAKLEVKELLAGYVRDAGMLGAAVALVFFAGMALVAALVIGTGALLDNYWLGAFIVCVLLVAVAAVLARAGIRHMKRNPLKPAQTVETLQEDKRWARIEIQDLKRQLKH